MGAIGTGRAPARGGDWKLSFRQCSSKNRRGSRSGHAPAGDAAMRSEAVTGLPRGLMATRSPQPRRAGPPLRPDLRPSVRKQVRLPGRHTRCRPGGKGASVSWAAPLGRGRLPDPLVTPA